MATNFNETDFSEFMNPNLEVMYTADEIRERINELGRQIAEDYKDSELVLVGVLKGSCVFMADLMREIDLPLAIDFMSVSSY